MDLNFELHPAQMEIFKSPAKFKVVAAGRRFGKSFLSAVLLLINALKEENEYGQDLTNKEVWYVAPTFQQGKDVMWNLLKTLGRGVIESTVENTATLRLINGRTIKIKGSDRPDTLRGVGLSFVVMDEYAFMKPQVWEEIIMPTLTEVHGRAFFIGTPEGKNHFYDLYVDAENDESGDWQAWHYNSVDNPFLPKDVINAAAQKMSAHAFRQEFEASFTATGAGIFKPDHILIDNNEPQDGQWYIAVDPAGFADEKEMLRGDARRLDETAISIVKVHRGGWWVKEIDAGRWNIRETSLRILRHAQDVRPSAIGIEKGSLKNAIMPYMEDQMRRLGIYPRVEPLIHGNQKKTERITWSLQGRFEHGRIKLCEGAWTKKFIDQLLDFPNPLTKDDMVDSLAYIDQLGQASYVDDLQIDYWEPLDLDAGY